MENTRSHNFVPAKVYTARFYSTYYSLSAQNNLKHYTIYVTGFSYSKMNKRYNNKPKAEVRNVAHTIGNNETKIDVWSSNMRTA